MILDPGDIETPWNKCPNVYWAEEDLLHDYNFGRGTKEVIWENQPDNRQRSWWQMSHAMSVIRELCKNQDPGYMDEKLTKFEDQLRSDLRHPDDRASIMKMTEKDHSIFGNFNLISETRFEPLFDEVDDESTREALKVCMQWAKSIGTDSPDVMLENHARCRTAVNRVVRTRR